MKSFMFICALSLILISCASTPCRITTSTHPNLYNGDPEILEKQIVYLNNFVQELIQNKEHIWDYFETNTYVDCTDQLNRIFPKNYDSIANQVCFLDKYVLNWKNKDPKIVKKLVIEAYKDQIENYKEFIFNSLNTLNCHNGINVSYSFGENAGLDQFWCCNYLTPIISVDIPLYSQYDIRSLYIEFSITINNPRLTKSDFKIVEMVVMGAI